MTRKMPELVRREAAFAAPERLDMSPFAKLSREAMKHAPSEQDVQRALRHLDAGAREERLRESGVAGAIAHEDHAAIVADSLTIETNALDWCRRWVAARDPKTPSASAAPRILALTGLTGRGKTVAGAWLIAQLGGRYVTAETLRRAFVGNHWTDKALLDLLLGTRCVVVDDAGIEDAYSCVDSMHSFVNQRAGDARAWTLITANLPEHEFRARYDERTIRRIEHNGSIEEVSGEDLRRKP